MGAKAFYNKGIYNGQGEGTGEGTGEGRRGQARAGFALDALAAADAELRTHSVVHNLP